MNAQEYSREQYVEFMKLAARDLGSVPTASLVEILSVIYSGDPTLTISRLAHRVDLAGVLADAAAAGCITELERRRRGI